MSVQTRGEVDPRHLQIAAWRQEKDRFFADHAESPILPEERPKFRGLAYYDVDAAWRVEATVKRDPGSTLVRLVPSRGIEPSQYIRYATATLRMPGGKTETLSLYTRPHHHEGHAAHEPDELFVPFRDGTSGTETYGAGRYLEVPNPLSEGQAEGHLLIDFNFAYSPFCAYNDGYVCPLPPKENWLQTEVRAGEKNPPWKD